MNKSIIILLMGILSFIRCKTTHSKNLSEQLEGIGYFDLIENKEKEKFVKEKIDIEFKNDDNPYIGKHWFIIPNDDYISDVYNLSEYDNKSSTSDFKAFEIWGGGLFSGEFESTLESANVVFQRNGLKLNWKDEIFDQTDNEIIHTVNINEKFYEVFHGTLTRNKMGEITYRYISRLREILNDVLVEQNAEYRVILLSQPETVYFILLSKTELIKFKKIVKKCKNKIED